jgi:signal transduction histidine kinase
MDRFFSDLRFSISTRLALWFGLSFLLLLSVFVIFLYTGFHVGLHRDFQEQLEDDQTRALDLVRRDGDGVRLQSEGPLSAGSYDVEGTGGTYVRLLSPRGAVLQRSANMQEESFAPYLPDGHEPEVVAHTWRGAPVRTVYTPISGPSGRPAAWLEVTRLESALHDELHRLGWLLVFGVLLAAAIAIAAGYYLARRALRPVAQITEAALQIQAQDLARRVPMEFGVRDELTELAETLNALLDRLAASFERERRFRADAAHEMFTPLSAIQSEIDVTLRRSRSGSEYQGALAAVRDHARRLKDIVEDLLELSRVESLEANRATTVDASEIASQVVKRFRSRADEESVHIEINTDEQVMMRVDPVDLETILSNLIDNALKYTLEGGRISVSFTRTATNAVLSVSDTGAGFTEEERRHLFDRFYRANGDAATQAPGSGLGLSIAKAIVLAYDGEIDAESEGPGRGSRFTVTFAVTESRVAIADESK